MEKEKLVNMQQRMMPKQDPVVLWDLLQPFDNKLYNIIEVPTERKKNIKYGG